MVHDALDKIHAETPITVLINGAATGVDSIASCWAYQNGVTCESYPAQWTKFGRAAGPLRNQRMIDFGKPDLVVAFPGGVGTADMIAKAREACVPVRKVQ